MISKNSFFIVFFLFLTSPLLSVQSILVTGGAGYIGSHIAYYLHQQGYHIIILDSACEYKHFTWAKCIAADYASKDTLNAIFEHFDIAAVVHCAAFIQVGESVRDPWKYYDNNVSKTLVLLNQMRKYQVKKLLFSSSAAVYGNPQWTPLTEDHPCNPINPYGRSKYMMELICKDFHQAYGLDYVIFRYFNAAGAMPDWGLGEDHDPETHLIPLLLQAATGQKQFSIFGSDYNTQDGTCIRDFIHVYDIAQAHFLGLSYLLNGGQSGCFNLGTGNGFSIRQIIEKTEELLQAKINCINANRRAGDPAVLVASAYRAQKILGWKPYYSTLDQILSDAYRFLKDKKK